MATAPASTSAPTTAVPSAPVPPVTTTWRSEKSTTLLRTAILHHSTDRRPDSRLERNDAPRHAAAGANHPYGRFRPRHRRRRHQRRRDRPRRRRPRAFACCWSSRTTSPPAPPRASTKLIHGGLRYLEHYEFRLVREALTEREVLLRIAPHIVRPLRFVLPHRAACGRPGCCGSACSSTTIWAAASGCRRPALDLARRRRRRAAQAALRARLRVLRLLGRRRAPGRAQRPGCRRARRRHPHAHACVRADATERRLAACDRSAPAARRRRAPASWSMPPALGRRSRTCSAPDAAADVRLVKGSHIVVPQAVRARPRLHLPEPDGRVVFAIPFEDDFTLIGTTDATITAIRRRSTTAEEIDYLCEAASPISRRRCAGRRRLDLLRRAAALRRRHGKPRPLRATTCWSSTRAPGDAPLLSIFGGKITTYRRLAEDALGKLSRSSATRAGWTDGARCPAAISTHAARRAARRLRRALPFLTEGLPAAWRAPTARGRRTCLRPPVSLDDLGRTSAPT